MTSNHLITAVLTRSNKAGNQYAMLSDAFSHVKHTIIVCYLEGMILKGMNLGKWDFYYLFPLFIRTAFLCREQIIY